MSEFRRLVHEIHRRSLWQVTLTYLGLSWVVLQVAEHVMEQFALPDWVYGAVVIALLVGFPVVVATAVVQAGGSGNGYQGGAHEMADAGAAGGSGEPRRDRPAEPASPADQELHLQDVFRWRNAVLGGVMAGLAVVVSVGIWYVTGGAGYDASGVAGSDKPTIAASDPGPSESRDSIGRSSLPTPRQPTPNDAGDGTEAVDPRTSAVGTARADPARSADRDESRDTGHPPEREAAAETGTATPASDRSPRNTIRRTVEKGDTGAAPAEADLPAPLESDKEKHASLRTAEEESVTTSEDTTAPSDRQEATAERPDRSRTDSLDPRAAATARDDNMPPAPEIVSTTLSRLRRSIESEDLDSLRAIWVTLGADEARNFKRFFDNATDIRITFEPDWDSLRRTGDRIEIASRTRWVYVSDVRGRTREESSFEQHFELERRRGSWVVVGY